MDRRSRLVMWLVVGITLLTGCSLPARPAPGPTSVPVAAATSTRPALPTMTLPPVPVVIAIPDVISGGTLVTLEGSNLRPNDLIKFYLRDPAKPTEPIVQLGTGQTDADGRFTWSFTYPIDSRWTSVSAASVIVQSTATGGYTTVPLPVVLSGTTPTSIVPTSVPFTLTPLPTPILPQTPTSAPTRMATPTEPPMSVAAAPAEDAPSPASDVGHRPDIPDVSRQFSSAVAYAPPPQYCVAKTLKTGRLIELDSLIYSIPAILQFCLDGFQPGTVAVQLIRPDGKMRPLDPQPISFATNDRFDVMVPLIDPPGTYTITVSQGTVAATGTVSLKEAQEPEITIFPLVAPSDTLFTVYLTGFVPNARVMLDVYLVDRCTLSTSPLVITPTFATCHNYQKSFAVNTDHKGQAVASLGLSGLDGKYILEADNGSVGLIQLKQSAQCALANSRDLKICASSSLP